MSKCRQNKVDEEKLPWYYNLYSTLKNTPINCTLLIVSAFVFYKVVKITHRRRNKNLAQNPQSNGKLNINAKLPALKCDMNVKELREYDGVRPDGRILVAVNFNIYDVSCAKHFYGKDGTYPHYAGCDISRNLINFSAEKNERENFDDLSDLTTKQKSTLLEWDHQYSDRYPLVGRLLPEQEPSIDFDIEKSESEDIAALEEQFM